MTFMSWFVIFIYSALQGGNILLGIIALIGLCFAHLAANVLDDYFDYKSLIKQVNFDKKEYLRNSQKTKCRYIISGKVKAYEILIIAFVYLILGGLIAGFLFLKCGIGVIYYTLIGLLIVLLYSFMSKARLSELAIGICYGPALFGGVYYVMTRTYSWDVFLLSIPTMIITIVLLYIHTIMDYYFDINEGHRTIANSFSTPKKSLIVLKILLFAAYLYLILLCILDILDWQVFFVYLTIPLAIDLYKSMKEFSTDPESIPEKKWFHFPMENMMNAPSFMMRIYQSRNLLIYFALFLCAAIFLGLGL